MSQTLETVQREILSLEEQGASQVPMEKVKELIAAVQSTLSNEDSTGDDDASLYGRIGELAQFISNAKKELQQLNDGDLAEQKIPDASDQLDEVIRMTESATGRIMDGCESIENLHQRLRDQLVYMDPPLDPDALAGIEDCLGEAQASIVSIFEACNFQDVTGQRIQKIVTVLKEVERKILAMVLAFGLKRSEAELDDETKAGLQADADLLNGPSLEGSGLEQDQIDQILAKLL